MSLQLTCPGCGSLMNVPEELAGRRIRCKNCQTIVTVPAGGHVTASRPTSSSPPMVTLVDDVDQDQDEEEEFEESGSNLGLVALVVGLGVLVTGLIGVGVWWFWPRQAANQANNQPQETILNLRDKYLQQAANLDKFNSQQRKEFLQRLTEDLKERKVFFPGPDAEKLLDGMMPLLQDKEVRPLLLQFLYERADPFSGLELQPHHWSQLAKLDIKSLSPEEKRALLGIVQNLKFGNEDPNYRYLAKVLAEDPDLKSIVSKPKPFEVEPPAFGATPDLEKTIEELRGKPPSKDATPLLASALRALRTQRPKEPEALFQAIRPYLDDTDLRNAYLARTILLRTASPDHIAEVLMYGELPKLGPEDFFRFNLGPQDLPGLFNEEEVMNMVRKYLSNPAVHKKLLESAKSPNPRFQEALPKLLLYGQWLPGELLDALFIQNPQADGETISRWLAPYSTNPLLVSSPVLTILARTKDEGVRKAIVNWFQNCKPRELDRLRFESQVRDRCLELMKDSNAAPNILPVLLLFTRFSGEWKQYAKHPDPKVRHMVLERLAEDVNFGVTEIIPHLAIPQDQQKAKELLLQMFDKHGANSIEPAILSHLSLQARTNPTVILPLLEIPRDKGTARSLFTLQSFTKYPDPQIAKAAYTAIVAIKKRGS